VTKIKLFRTISLPFYLLYELLYGLIFNIRPLGNSVFAVEGKPRKYRGPTIISKNGSLLENGAPILRLHLRRKMLMKILTGPRPKEKLVWELESALVSLAQLVRKPRQNFSGFVGETTIVFPKAEKFGFIMTPKNSTIADFLTTLQQIYFKKEAKRFIQKKVFIYFYLILNKK
jgi:hypothetical protein